MHDPNHYARLSDILVQRALATPQAAAVQDRLGALTYQGLAGKAAALARDMVAHDIGGGDRVFLLIGNSTRFAVAFWAVQMAGAVVVPLPVDTPAERLDWMVRDSTPALILAEPGVTAQGAPLWTVTPEALDDAHPPASHVAAEDLALMIYTSGSTGTPKGVMLSQRAVVTAACSVATYLGYRAEDRIFCAIPFTFDYGMHQLTMAALVGASVYAERDFSQPFISLNTLARSGATVLPLVPTLGALLVQIGARFDLSRLRIVTNTAAALGSTLIDDLRNLMPSAQLFSMYGLTECHRCTYLEPDHLDRRKASVGKAIPYTRMWVVDDQGNRHDANATGELVIAGDTIMQGYWRRPDATAARLKILPDTGETVFHTGDICRLDAEGYCYFVGRADDILKVRGQKVSPVEVERCLLTHPDLAQAAILGQEDPLLGTAVIAVVEPVPGATCDPTELIAYAAARLPLHARPVRIQIERSLPRNANGKIDKRAIRLAEPVA